jgi:uncharacterized protein YqeY
MSLKSKIETEIKQAMLAKNKERLTALRSIKSLILLAETEKGAKQEINEAGEIAILTKAAKQRKDSLAIYETQNRADLAAVEQQELVVIEEFLPKQLSESEVRDIIKAAVTKLGATTIKDMGKVMGAVSKDLAGKADNKLIADIIKSQLS